MSKTTATVATPKTPKSTKPSANGKTPKSELRKPQVAVLRTLAKVGKPMTRKQISEKSSVDQSSLSGYIGSYDPTRRQKDDAARFTSLISYGYVKVEQHDVEGRDVVLHEITAKGRKAIEAIK